MLQRKNIGVCFILLCVMLSASAQKIERDYIRKGNRAFKDSTYIDAEVNYRKALEVNPKSAVSMFNLGDALIQQNKLKEAVEQFSNATNFEKDKSKLAQIYHNIGVILHSQKDYAQAIEAYKQALRNNPKDDETRYNLALAQKMLKNQNNQQNQNKENKEQQEKEEPQKQQQNQEQNNQDQQSPQSNKDNEEMSKENAEQLLNSVMQDEQNVQEKVKKQQVIQGNQLEKDW